MMLFRQIAKASLVLIAGALIHIGLLFEGAQELVAYSNASANSGWVVPAIAAFLIVLVAHTINVWIWAGVLRWIGALETMETAVYFSLVTTTTLGYGDVVLPHRWRVFGAMAAVSGLLTFGLSTAFLITIMQTLFETGLG